MLRMRPLDYQVLSQGTKVIRVLKIFFQGKSPSLFMTLHNHKMAKRKPAPALRQN